MIWIIGVYIRSLIDFKHIKNFFFKISVQWLVWKLNEKFTFGYNTCLQTTESSPKFENSKKPLENRFFFKSPCGYSRSFVQKCKCKRRWSRSINMNDLIKRRQRIAAFLVKLEKLGLVCEDRKLSDVYLRPLIYWAVSVFVAFHKVLRLTDSFFQYQYQYECLA